MGSGSVLKHIRIKEDSVIMFAHCHRTTSAQSL